MTTRLVSLIAFATALGSSKRDVNTSAAISVGRHSENFRFSMALLLGMGHTLSGCRPSISSETNAIVYHRLQNALDILGRQERKEESPHENTVELGKGNLVQSVFLPAYDAVVKLLQSDSFRRFIDDPRYKEWVELGVSRSPSSKLDPPSMLPPHSSTAMFSQQDLSPTTTSNSLGLPF